MVDTGLHQSHSDPASWPEWLPAGLPERLSYLRCGKLDYQTFEVSSKSLASAFMSANMQNYSHCSQSKYRYTELLSGMALLHLRRSATISVGHFKPYMAGREIEQRVEATSIKAHSCLYQLSSSILSEYVALR